MILQSYILCNIHIDRALLYVQGVLKLRIQLNVSKTAFPNAACKLRGRTLVQTPEHKKLLLTFLLLNALHMVDFMF